MSLVTQSTKRKRVYQRQFDHDQARAMYAQGGWSYHALARHFDVSDRAVARVIDPAVDADMQARTLETLRAKRRPCKGGCGRLVWTHQSGRSGYCHACVWSHRAVDYVRPDALRCSACGEWKADGEFGPRKQSPTRRGREAACRACQSARRADYRARHPGAENAYGRRRYQGGKGGAMAVFVILELDGDGCYRELARVDSNTGDHAIEQAVEKAGTYVAIAETRFLPRKVESREALKVVSE
jgi:hypothetical protein